MINSVIEQLTPLLFSERIDRNKQGRIVKVTRGIDLENLSKVFTTRQALTAFVVIVSKRLAKIGFRLRVYRNSGWYLTAVPNINLPSTLTDPEAFVLAMLVTLSDGEEVAMKILEEEISELKIEDVQPRKNIETLVDRGLVECTSTNPLKFRPSGLFYVEFSEEAEIKMKGLVRYHFLLGGQ